MHHVARLQQVEQLEQICREHRLPLTVQRRAVFEAILEREDHPTADQTYDQVAGQVPGISRTTVYRILDIFVRLGLITKICHHGSAARFDPKIHQHHHLVCSHCETIIDLEDPRLDTITLPNVRRHGFKITDYHIHFRGVCANCRSGMKEGGRTAHQAGKRSTRTLARKTKQSRKKRSNKP